MLPHIFSLFFRVLSPPTLRICQSHFPRGFTVRVRRAGFIEMIASLAASAKVCKKVTLLKEVI
jgi:hypothetical protein